MNCKNCKHWFPDNYDAIGMGYCDVPVSLRETVGSLTAWDFRCSNFSERLAPIQTNTAGSEQNERIWKCC